jgi:hypothetical protein
MTQLPGFNLYAIHRREISPVLLSTAKQAVLRGVGDWFVCREPNSGLGVELLSGPHLSEKAALIDAQAMTDTGGT